MSRRGGIYNRAAGRERLRAFAPPHVTGGRNNAASWFRIENKGSATSVYIYDEIGFWGVTAQDFAADLGKLDASTLDVYINSPGGEVYDGIAIYNALKNHRASVTTHVDGLAASAASFIAQAGDVRVMARNAEMMIHDAMGAQFGNAAEMAEMAKQLDRVSNNIADIYAARSGADTLEVWRERMRAETWYSAREAVAAGLADQMTDDESAAEPKNEWGGLFRYRNRLAAPPPGRVVIADRRPLDDRVEPLPEQPETDVVLSVFDPELFRAAMELAGQDFAATAPPLRDPVPAVPATPAVPAFPVDALRRAIREGTAS